MFYRQSIFWNANEVSRRKRRKTRKRNKDQKEKRNEQRGPYGIPEDYAEELSPLLLLGRRSETGASRLGDAGEYYTREDCDAGVLSNCEYGGDTGENCEAETNDSILFIFFHPQK